MGWFDCLKVPPLPSGPVALENPVEVDRGKMLSILGPCDVGLTCGHGILGIAENIYRLKEKEGNNLYTHAFMIYGSGDDPEITESNWPRVRRGINASMYLGGNRHTVYARYEELETWQKMGTLSAADTMIQARTPYAGGQILGFLQRVLGMAVGNKAGVTCIEYVTVLLRGQQVPFCGAQQSFMTTPTSAFTWLTTGVAKSLRWKLVAEAVGNKYFVSA